MDKPQMDRQEYVEERRFLAQLEADAYKGFDKTLLAISSGAIALSVAFLDKWDGICFLHLLILAWISWFAAIILQICSYLYAAKAMREEVEILNEQYKDYAEEARNNPYLGVPTKFNIAAIVAFVLGTTLFLIFVVLSLN